jgi:hypothetical protein
MSSELIWLLLPSNLTALNIGATFGSRLNLKPFTAIKGLSDQIRMLEGLVWDTNTIFKYSFSLSNFKLKQRPPNAKHHTNYSFFS